MAFGPSASEVTRPDHPYLKDRGCWGRMMNGFWMGMIVGGTVGGVYSAANGLKYGLAGREFVRICGKQMFYVGASLGVFMMVGAFIRC